MVARGPALGAVRAPASVLLGVLDLCSFDCLRAMGASRLWALQRRRRHALRQHGGSGGRRTSVIVLLLSNNCDWSSNCHPCA